MSQPTSIELLSSEETCSRSEFKTQVAMLEAQLRDASRAALQKADLSDVERRRGEIMLERDVDHRLQRLILQAKGIISEEMLMQHRREIPVDEIPDYVVTDLLLELGERELRDEGDS